MPHWIELTSGRWINLDLVESVARIAGSAGAWRFHTPKFQLGSRPMGRPPTADRATSDYDENHHCWEGTPVNEKAMLAGLLGRHEY